MHGGYFYGVINSENFGDQGDVGNHSVSDGGRVSRISSHGVQLSFLQFNLEKLEMFHLPEITYFSFPALHFYSLKLCLC